MQAQINGFGHGFVFPFSLYTPRFYHFSTGIKGKKQKPKSIVVAAQKAIPTEYQLASLAVKFYIDSPEAHKDFPKHLNLAVQKAETLWLLSRDKISLMRKADDVRTFWEERTKKVMENVKRPKSFPISVDQMIRGLLPKLGRVRRDKLCEVVARCFQHLFFPSSPLNSATATDEYDRRTRDVITNRFKKLIDEPLWRKFVLEFQTWYPAYQRDVRSEKSRKAAVAANRKKNENSQLTENSERISLKQS